MIVALIPARFQSSRLPGKPLLKFGDHTMIQKVYLQVIQSKLIQKTYVVTDDIRIKENIEEIGGSVLLVNEECLNGTERICLAIHKYPDIFSDSDIIVNVQGDEPFINPIHIDLVISKYPKAYNVVCSTLHYHITKSEELTNPSIGKLVLDKNNNIMYCSRACLPSNKQQCFDINNTRYFGHIGVFVFSKDYLLNYYQKENTPQQLQEDIEWLKIIEQGFKIISSEVSDYEIGVNTPEDYQYLLHKYYLS